jgi:hypothetical protein
MAMASGIPRQRRSIEAAMPIDNSIMLLLAVPQILASGTTNSVQSPKRSRLHGRSGYFDLVQSSFIGSHAMTVGAINGPDGLFEVDFVGTRPDAEYRFLYKDGTEHFFFIANFNLQPTVNWVIVSANLESNAPFKTVPARGAILKRNIELFFKTRNWTNPSQPGDAGTAATPVAFQWRIV